MASIYGAGTEEMKAAGQLTHARFAAEASRIVRKASKRVAHETLRMHSGDHKPDGLVRAEDVASFCAEIEEILVSVRS